MPAASQPSHPIRFERVDAVRETPHGIEADLHGERLRVDVVADDVVRLQISRAGRFDETPTHAVCVDPLAGRPSFGVERADGVVRVRTAGLVATVGLDPFRLDVHRPDGTPVLETAEDADGVPCAYATLNDQWEVHRRCHRQDAFYGLGERGGAGDRKGRAFTLWNLDVLEPRGQAEFTSQYPPEDPRSDCTSIEMDPYYVAVPLLHHHAHATGDVASSFVDNGWRGHYDFTDAETFTLGFDGGQYTEYVFAGPAFGDVMRAYTALTGRAPLPPLWALGHHQSRWHHDTQADVLALARRMRDERVPCDVIWLDIEHMDGYRVFTWDGERFPDPPAMLAQLRAEGVRVITIVDPGVKHDPGYRVYDDAVARDVLARTEGGDHFIGQVWPGNTTFPDFATAEARAWWGELNAAHVASGLAGVWNDMNEPATGDVAPGRMRFDRGRVPHEALHNQYALLMAMGTVEGLRSARPDHRTFVLSRAGSAGIQRYAANWMGDNQSRWDHLWVSMPMAAGMGLSGQPFVGADVGGFQGDTNAELFLRWMQYGALTPFCRNHNEIDQAEQYPWSFGAAVRDGVRAALEGRYRLLPYLYAAFVEAAETGAPVQRPLVYDHQHDRAVRGIDDQFTLGRDLLVAPVVAPGTTARAVYLPAGTWYDWHTGERHAGERWLHVPTPPDRIPVFARGGAVIPTWPSAPQTTLGHRPQRVQLHVFAPEADGTHVSQLQEDDGETFAALEGARYRTTLTVTRSGDALTLDAAVAGDGFPELDRRGFELVGHGCTPERTEVDAAAGEGFSLRLQPQ